MNFIVFCFISYTLNLYFVDARYQFLISMLFFTDYLYWFVLGMGFYFYHVDKKRLALIYILSSILFFFMTNVDEFVVKDLIVLILVTSTFFVLNENIFSKKYFHRTG